MIIYQGPSRLTGAPIVAILTGLDRPSSNGKTGDMPQLWILSDDGRDPFAARKAGADEAVCGDCPLRDGRCYVNLLRGPLAIYRAYLAGRYPDGRALDADGIRAACCTRLGRPRSIRLGAYGDPAALPLDVVERLCAASPVHTGYTHAWRRFPELRPFLMASADSQADADEAHALGWRTFRVVCDGGRLADGELWCPAAPEGGATRTCATCGLCRGGSRGPSIAIRAHGSAVAMSVWGKVERLAGEAQLNLNETA